MVGSSTSAKNLGVALTPGVESAMPAVKPIRRMSKERCGDVSTTSLNSQADVNVRTPSKQFQETRVLLFLGMHLSRVHRVSRESMRGPTACETNTTFVFYTQHALGSLSTLLSTLPLVPLDPLQITPPCVALSQCRVKTPPFRARPRLPPLLLPRPGKLMTKLALIQTHPSTANGHGMLQIVSPSHHTRNTWLAYLTV